MNARQREIGARLDALGPLMKPIVEKSGPLTTEDKENLTNYKNEMLALADEGELLAHSMSAMDRQKELLKSRGSVTDSPEAGAVSGQVQGGADVRQIDRRSIGQRFAQSQAVKDWLGGPEIKGRESAKFRLGRAPSFDDAGAEIPSGPSFTYDGQGPINRLAVISGTGLPSFMPAPQVLPEIVRPRDYALTMRQVISGGSTTTDTIYFVKENVFTNATAPVAESTVFDPTTPSATNAKPQSSLTFTQDSVAVKTMAAWVPITKQAIADNAQLQSYVEGRLIVGAERTLNSEIANGDGSGEHLLGLLHVTGLLDLDDAYFSGLNPALPNAADNNAIFNRLLWAATLIETSSDALATFIALHPYDLARMRMFSDANRQYMSGGPFVEGPIPTLWGLPVARDRDIPQGTALVGDGTAAMYFDREEANILIGWVNDQFIHNQLTILAELRGALATFRPAAFAAVDITL